MTEIVDNSYLTRKIVNVAGEVEQVGKDCREEERMQREEYIRASKRGVRLVGFGVVAACVGAGIMHYMSGITFGANLLCEMGLIALSQLSFNRAFNNASQADRITRQMNQGLEAQTA